MAVKKQNEIKVAEPAEMEKKQENIEECPVFTPATDIYDDGKSIVMVIDMPGVETEGLDVQLHEGSLTITGRQTPQKPDACELLHWGYSTGMFQRSFRLASEVNQEKIDAKLKNGVLTLTLPKAEKALPKKIKVENAI